MRTILIADDEKIEREGIKFLLKQSQLEIEIKEAINGKVALEYLKQHKVDILFTDVKMPFMDGLQLLDEALQLNPELESVIFSGFNEFDFARKAIQLGVNNYILKPVDPEELHITLQRIWDKLDEKERQVQIRKKENDYMYEHILYQLVNGVSTLSLIERSKNTINFDKMESYQRMILIETGNNFFEKVDGVIADKIKSEFHINLQYLNLNMQQSLLFMEKGEPIDYEVLAKRIHEYIMREYKEFCYIAVSKPLEGINDIANTYIRLEELMENKFYQPKDPIFKEEKYIKERVEDTPEEELVNLIMRDIQNKNVDNLNKNFKILCNKYKKRTSFSQIYVKFTFSNIMKEISSKLTGFDEKNLEKNIKELYQSTKIQEVIELTESYIKKLEKSIEDTGVRGEIQAIKNYIYENYHKDISIERLAEEVFLSPSYVSYIFKKETGCNLSKFLKAYRMERAKECLQNSKMKIVNICEKVGYANVSYFCQNFKEYYGVSPEKFRQVRDIYEKDDKVVS